MLGDFPGSAVVKSSPANAGGVGWIPHASWPKNQTVNNRSNTVKDSIDFKNDPHQKNYLKKMIVRN